MEKIRISCDTKDAVALEDLVEFQGDLKALDDADAKKLRSEILTTGFAFPVHVWKEPRRGTLYIIGGHQRVRVLKAIKAEGIEVPPVPVVFIKAKNQDEAKRRVIQDVAQYGRVQSTGLFDFMQSANMEVNELAANFRIPDMDMKQFQQAFFPPEKDVNFTAKGGGGTGAKELDEGDFQEFEHHCPKCGFEFN